ncbi:MAG: MBL fold metallo-hydrolase, partial [Acidobacteriota bacterium]
PFSFEGIDIIPVPVGHGEWTILGFRIGPFAYLTDTNSIPEASMKLLEGLELLAIDALRPAPPHPTHFTIGESVEVARRIGARRTLLIHLAHEADHDAVAAGMPPGFEPAYDGLEIEL